MQLFELFGVVKLDDQASKGLDQLDGKAEKSGGKFGKFVGTVGKGALILGTAAVATGGALFAMTNKVTQGFDHIAKTSTKLGVTTDAYQEMEYWAGQNGVSTGNMEKAVGRLNQRLGDVKNGSDKYDDALKRLGISTEDVKSGTLSTEDAMYQSISALSKMENEQEKAALASELFGTKLGRELMPALQDGSLSLEDAAKKAEDLGIVIDGDVLASAEDFQDSWDDLTRSLGAFGQKIIGDLIPVFQVMMDWVLDHMPQIQAFFKSAFDVAGDAISAVIDWITLLIEWVRDFATENAELLETIKETFITVFDAISEGIEVALEWLGKIGTAIQENSDIIIPALVAMATVLMLTMVPAWWASATAAIASAAATAIAFLPVTLAILAVGLIVAGLALIWRKWGDDITRITKATIDWVVDKFNWMKEQISVIVKLIVSVVKNNFEAIQKNIKLYMEMAKSIIKTILDFWKNTFKNVLSFLKALVTGDFKGMKDAIKNQMDNIKNTISNIWNAIKTFMSSVIKNIVTAATKNFDNLKSSATEIFNNVKDVMVKPVEKARDLIGAAIDKVKGFFSGLSLKFPKIKMPKLPKFSMEGKFGLAPPSVPKLKLNWNAMGGVASGPTIANTSRGLQGFGEVAGESEAFLPLNDQVLGAIGKGIADTMGGTNDNQPIVVEVHVTSVIDGEVAARSLEPAVTVIQNRKVKVRESFAT